MGGYQRYLLDESGAVTGLKNYLLIDVLQENIDNGILLIFVQLQRVSCY